MPNFTKAQIIQTQRDHLNTLDHIGLYLGGPMQNTTDKEKHEWRNEMIQRLAPYSVKCYDPTRHNYTPFLETVSDLEPIDEAIIGHDKGDIRTVQVLLCNYYKVSSGSAMEILLGWELGKYVITVVPSYRGTSPWIRFHSSMMLERTQDNLFPYEYVINHLHFLCPKLLETQQRHTGLLI